MAVNFPSSPYIGEIFTYGALSWEWNGTYWESYSFPSSGLTGATSVGVGDSVISNIVNNVLELKSFSGDGITIIDDGNTLTFSSTTSPGGSVTSVSGGTGLSGNSTTGNIVLINTAPDQTVTISGGTGITTGGTYPNFTLVNSAPDQTVTITGGTNMEITGTYPNFGVNFTGTTGGGDYLPLSGGTVTGETIFQSGLTANTISATTYNNLPVSGITNGAGITSTTSNGVVTITNTEPDQIVTISGGTGITTGGTYPNFTITNSLPDQTVTITGGTNIQINGSYPNFGIDFTGQTSFPYLPLSGGTITGDVTFQSGLTANTISATTYQNLPSQSGTGVNALSYSQTTGGLTLTKNDATTLTAGTFTYLTGISYSNNVITSTNNLGSSSTLTINSVTGLTINGNLSVTGTTSSGTISATTYQNLPFSGTVTGTGSTKYLARWGGTSLLNPSDVYNDTNLIGLFASAQTYSEKVTIDTGNSGLTMDGLYFIYTTNGSIGLGTGIDYSSWAGYGEIAIGTRGTLINSIGSGNIGIGDKALNFNTTGNNNVAIGGTGSLLNNYIGNDNITIGNQSMNQNIDGSDNVSVGSDSLYNNVSGNRNVAIGQQSGYNNGGSSNVFIGRIAGFNHLGSNSIFIGENSDFPDTSQNYVLSVGNLIYGSISGKTVGINVTAQTNTLHVSASTNPVRFEGLQLSSNTRYLVADGNGVVTYRNLPGSSASDCFGTFYTSAISGCSPVTILTPLNATGGLNVTGTTNFTNTVDFSGGLTATTISATTYQNLPVSGLTQGSNITITNNGNGNYTISSTGGGGGGVTGSGTANYLTRWTGTTALGNSQIRDDGTNVGVGTVPSNSYKMSIYSITNTPLYVQNQTSNGTGINVLSNGANSQTGISSIGYGGASSNNTGIIGQAYDGLLAIGVKGIVGVTEFGSITTGIGGYFDGIGDGGYSVPTNAYSVQLVDGTEGTNKVLISVTSDGKANWSNTLTGLTNVRSTTISATTYQNLPVSAVTNGTGISTLTTNGIATITNTDLGSSQNIFKNIQIDGVTQFSAGSNSANLNFSGLNMTITSAATNTLVFSSGIKNIQTTSDGTAITNTTTSTLTSSVLIPANTVSVGDIINIRTRIRKTGTGGTVILRFYINTSAAIGGSLVGTSTTAAATTLYMQIPRTLVVKSSTNTETFQAGGTSTLDDVVSTGAVASNNISWTSAQYLVVAVQNGSLTDSTVCSFISAQINKQ